MDSTHSASLVTKQPDHTPPSGNDERRLQVRAYNIWASLLNAHTFPLLADLPAEVIASFAQRSVLLDFSPDATIPPPSIDVKNPRITHLGELLLQECASEQLIQSIADVPAHSLLSQITDQYQQIFTNKAPIGFEAEFTNPRGLTFLCRGIMLPFSRTGEKIDYIYGLINWKERSEPLASNPQQKNIQPHGSLPKIQRDMAPLTEWADSPVDQHAVPLMAYSDAYPDMSIDVGINLPNHELDADLALVAEAPALMAALRAIKTQPFPSGAPQKDESKSPSEFTLLITRRLPNGEVAVVGEVSDENLLLKAAHNIVKNL